MSHLDATLPTEHPIRSDIEALIERLEAATAPVVSLYLDVHADSDPNAPAQRADAALRDLPLERDVRERIESRLSETLRRAGEGTLCFFAAEDPDQLLETVLLRVAPPLPGGADPAAARRGTPWTAPLALSLASDPPVVAVFADARRARVFVYDLGEVVEASAYVRALDPSGWRRYQEAETGMPGTPARGGSGRDDFEARKEAWTRRFVDDVMERVGATVAAREGARLVLLGEPRQRRQLEEALPAPLEATLLASTSVPADPDLDVARWRDPLAELVRDALHAEDAETLERLEEHGVAGTEAVLNALQLGELKLVAVPVDADVDVVHCIGTDWLAEDERAARTVCPDGPIERAPLKRFLLDVARKGRAQVRVMRGEAADRLTTRLGPIAGLPRRS